MKDTRRGFLKSLAGIGLFTILPGAGRIWKTEKYIHLPNPGWLPNDVAIYNRLPYRFVRESLLIRPAIQDAFERLLDMKPDFHFTPTFQDIINNPPKII